MSTIPIISKHSHVISFPPIMDERHNDAKILILGSAPSVKSLDDVQYYAHPQNAFWWIMSELFEFDMALSYAEREKRLIQKNVIVWDVLASCERQGSLDSHIQTDTEVANDIPLLLTRHPQLSLIVCNGGAAYRLFKKHHSDVFAKRYVIKQMPSTSPAYASISKHEKLAQWSIVKQHIFDI